MYHFFARLLPRPALAAAALMASATLASAQYSTPVRDIDEPARNRFRLEYSCVEMACSTSQTVPAGYIFVIENVFFKLSVGAMAAVIPAPTASHQDIALPPTYSTAINSYGVHSLRIYSDGQPLVSPTDSNPVGSSKYIYLYGYLVKK